MAEYLADTLKAGIELGATLGTWGELRVGPLRLSSYRIDELAGQEYALGRLQCDRRAWALPDILGSGVSLGASAGVGRVSALEPSSAGGCTLSGRRRTRRVPARRCS